MFRNLLFVLILNLVSYSTLTAQKSNDIQWLSFEQLEDSLAVNPKKVFIDFYADWCTPCLKMHKTTFLNPDIVKELNNNYYAIKMNVESRDTIVFGGSSFTNKRWKKRNPVHEIPLLMASRKNKAFSLPAIILFNEKFVATERYFQYLNAKQLLQIL